MQLDIRIATVEDVKEISDIWKVICAERVYSAVNRPFTPEQMQEYIKSLTERENIFLAIINDLIVGFQSLDMFEKFTDSFDHVGVVGTFILPEWRHRGIGYKLAKHTFKFANKNGFEKILIYVRSRNTVAQIFYKNLGFVAKGILSKHVKIDGQYEDEIFMELMF